MDIYLSEYNDYKMHSQNFTNINMRAQITATTEDLGALDYTGAEILNFYMTTSDTGETVFDKPVTFYKLRTHLFQAMFTKDLLSGNFSSLSMTRKGVSFHAQELVGWSDGTGDGRDYDGLCMTFYIRHDSANDTMKEVIRALPLVQEPVSIRIRLSDGRIVTINENFPRWGGCGWNPSHVEFAKKFVMK